MLGGVGLTSSQPPLTERKAHCLSGLIKASQLASFIQCNLVFLSSGLSPVSFTFESTGYTRFDYISVHCQSEVAAHELTYCSKKNSS